MRQWLTGLWWRSRPRCAAPGPGKLPGCGRCVRPRGHEQWPDRDPAWHADGEGYIWNDTEGRWRWMGEPVSVADYYDPTAPAPTATFTEPTPEA